jgi:hypothetical protein
MLIFQINQDKLDKELNSTDWLFWNNYLASRAQEDDYVLLPAFIDYIQDTNQPTENGQFFVELDDNEDNLTT